MQKKILLIITFYSMVFTQIPYISSGINVSINNKEGMKWGYELTGGLNAGMLHAKISYGNNYFHNSPDKLDYLTVGVGLFIFGYEYGIASYNKNNKWSNGYRSNFYIGGMNGPLSDLLGTGEYNIMFFNFYSFEKYKFPDMRITNHKLWTKIGYIHDCFYCG